MKRLVLLLLLGILLTACAASGPSGKDTTLPPETTLPAADTTAPDTAPVSTNPPGWDHVAPLASAEYPAVRLTVSPDFTALAGEFESLAYWYDPSAGKGELLLFDLNGASFSIASGQVSGGAAATEPPVMTRLTVSAPEWVFGGTLSAAGVSFNGRSPVFVRADGGTDFAAWRSWNLRLSRPFNYVTADWPQENVYTRPEMLFVPRDRLAEGERRVYLGCIDGTTGELVLCGGHASAMTDRFMLLIAEAEAMLAGMNP